MAAAVKERPGQQVLSIRAARDAEVPSKALPENLKVPPRDRKPGESGGFAGLPRESPLPGTRTGDPFLTVEAGGLHRNPESGKSDECWS